MLFSGLKSLRRPGGSPQIITSDKLYYVTTRILVGVEAGAFSLIFAAKDIA